MPEKKNRLFKSQVRDTLNILCERLTYEGRSEINASYLFPWKLQQIQRAQ